MVPLDFHQKQNEFSTFAHDWEEAFYFFLGFARKENLDLVFFNLRVVLRVTQIIESAEVDLVVAIFVHVNRHSNQPLVTHLRYFVAPLWEILLEVSEGLPEEYLLASFIFNSKRGVYLAGLQKQVV